jgi:hypothetical protein
VTTARLTIVNCCEPTALLTYSHERFLSSSYHHERSRDNRTTYNHQRWRANRTTYNNKLLRASAQLITMNDRVPQHDLQTRTAARQLYTLHTHTVTNDSSTRLTIMNDRVPTARLSITNCCAPQTTYNHACHNHERSRANRTAPTARLAITNCRGAPARLTITEYCCLPQHDSDLQ